MRRFEEIVIERGLADLDTIPFLLKLEEHFCTQEPLILPLDVLQRVFLNLLTEHVNLSATYFKHVLKLEDIKILLEIISAGYSWNNSPEGYCYWSNIVSILERNQDQEGIPCLGLLWEEDPESPVYLPAPQEHYTKTSTVILL